MTDHTCSYECERPECIRAQRDELRADAERYRWLAANKFRHNGHCLALTGPILWEETLDAAIDAAIREQLGETE